METHANNIIHAVRDPLLVLGRELRVTLANRAFFKLFQSTPEKTHGLLLADLGNGQWNSPALNEKIREVLAEDSEFNDYEVEHDFPSIGWRTILLNGRSVSDPNSKTKLILLAMEDITNRRVAERELTRQRAWFETTLASIGDAVIATDAHARVTFLNPSAEMMTGWSRQQAVGKPLQDVFHIVNESTRKTVESPVTKALRQGNIVGLANHTILIARDSTERPIDDSAAPIRDELTGKILGVVMVFHDISERRKAELKTEASEVRYRRLFEAAHDGILILDTVTRKITDVNPFLLELLDYPRQHFIGKELWEIGIFRDKDANLKAMQTLHENGSVRFENLPLQDRNGHRHPVEIVANIYQEAHEPVIQCNIRDIGERVLFERQRAALLVNEQAARMEAEAANRSKDVFLATLSHEVRTPLNAILGWASILRSPNHTEADVAEGMEVIERNCKVQAQLIEDVLDISRIVSGKLELRLASAELTSIIHAAIDTIQPAADAKHLRLEINLDPAASPVTCDINRMQQVIWNLLANAVKFTPPGKTLFITLTHNHTSASIQIRDEGQGITPDFLPFVFDRFRQADSSTRRKLGGLGLGLSIVKHIVEVHGGTVHVESLGEGRGATFTVNLPLREQASKALPSSSLSDLPPLPPIRIEGLRVLVVDDEADARRLLHKVLSDAGAIVTTAASVPEALASIAASPPEVLISDIAMPNSDGYDLIRQVRAQGLNAKSLPAIALTAFAHKDDRLRMLLAGFQIHLPKPIDPHDLIALTASLAARTG